MEQGKNILNAVPFCAILCHFCHGGAAGTATSMAMLQNDTK
jgi:hypothetical protein